MERIENPALMEPLLPEEGNRILEDLAIELVASAAKLAGKLAPETVQTVSALVRSMNCYYSNLIEGHNTHPAEIELALRGEYAKDPTRRNLQLEAFAHIEVQAAIDTQDLAPSEVFSSNYIRLLHREFCKRLPPELLESRDPKSDRKAVVMPGEWRTNEVVVGNHLAPVARELPKFLEYFDKRYNPTSLSAVMRVLAVPASHHRLLWIHPFLDGNGRVARIFSHALLKSLKIGSGLWSISRGLARNVGDYKAALGAADDWRVTDLDGRGSLSQSGLNKFCEFFLRSCIDQVSFMESLLEPGTLTERVRRFCEDEIETKRLPRGSFEVLRELILTGVLPRGRVAAVTGYQERQARKVSKALIERGLLSSNSPKAELKLQIPHEVVEVWFPKLYPPG